jgi:Flp pilus assembly protein TadG
MLISRRAQRLWTNDSGASALEFAMTLPAFVMMVFGTIQFGYAFFCGSTVQFALERVARIVMVDNSITQSSAQSHFDTELDNMGGPEATLTYTVDTTGPIPIARLQATYNHHVVIPLVPEFTLTFVTDTSVPQP